MMASTSRTIAGGMEYRHAHFFCVRGDFRVPGGRICLRGMRCLCVLVGSPTLFEPECRTPGQMRMANAFCRYLETATPVADRS